MSLFGWTLSEIRIQFDTWKSNCPHWLQWFHEVILSQSSWDIALYNSVNWFNPVFLAKSETKFSTSIKSLWKVQTRTGKWVCFHVPTLTATPWCKEPFAYLSGFRGWPFPFDTVNIILTYDLWRKKWLLKFESIKSNSQNPIPTLRESKHEWGEKPRVAAFIYFAGIQETISFLPLFIFRLICDLFEWLPAFSVTLADLWFEKSMVEFQLHFCSKFTVWDMVCF